MGAEIVGGLIANSLALLAAAGHMLSDADALGLRLFAMRFARRPPSAQRTYGSYHAEILAALVNGATLVAVAIYIFVEAFERFTPPPQVQGARRLDAGRRIGRAARQRPRTLDSPRRAR
jgi:cobalt-zinc-cadmium efflux system protein